MRVENTIILFLIALICLGSAHIKHYLVKYIHDGDTIYLHNGFKVRYIGIDAPEIDHKEDIMEFMAFKSREMNSHLVYKRYIYLEFDIEKRDRYGRLLAYAFLQNGDMVNILMLKHGLAWIMTTPPNNKYFSVFLKSQRQAISEKLGLWQRHIVNTESSYTGNKQSFRFHRPDCPFGKSVSLKNQILFKTVQDAFWDGFSPCKECLSEIDLFSDENQHHFNSS